ncbi:MAG: cytochrome P450 [Opitutaceae bacterium]|nr:cytochrome P450 [Opitutaceae bacterium]
MFSRFRQALPRPLSHSTIAYAYARAAVSRHRLPPGDLARLDVEEKTDRAFILHQAERLGPIFKAIGWGEFYICVVGLALGRRLLRDHGDDLRPMTLDLTSLFPKGFLRQMQGDDHRHYRRALNRAIKPGDLEAGTRELEQIALCALADYAAGEGAPREAAEAYLATLSTITTAMTIQLFFGAAPGTAAYDRLLAGYRKLGPHGLVWNVTPQQQRAFVEIRDFLQERFAGDPARLDPAARQSVLGRMVEDGMPDATMIGNLIYMVETGRYDTHALLRWLTKHAVDNPAMLARMAAEADAAPAPGVTFTEAFVLETLRMNQSERLMRRAQRDFVFDGFLIPKRATVRVCLWESHKSPDAFPQPFEFNPDRFLTAPPSSDAFAPFGLDQHKCPFSDMSVRMSVLFLRALARSYTVAAVADGRPIRGAYHWEPATHFGVRLQRRTSSPA